MGAVKCLACGQILISKHRHDYRTCGCPQNTMVDGGDEYTRTGGKEMAKVQHLHPITLLPVDRRDLTAAVGDVPPTTVVGTPQLMALINSCMKVLDAFPDGTNFEDVRRDSPFKDELLEQVIAARLGLGNLRDSILANHEAKAPTRSRKARPVKEQPGVPS